MALEPLAWQSSQPGPGGGISWGLKHIPIEDTLKPVAAILCTGGPDVIRKEAWSFYRTISGDRLCWELEEPKGRGVHGGRGGYDPE